MIKKFKTSTGFDLEWNEEGIGYLELPDQEHVYDKEYWTRYQSMKNTSMGKQLTKARIDLANKYVDSPNNVIDVGIGNGQFVEEYGCFGSDINPYAIEWLKSINKYSTIDDDYGYKWQTYWDVWEHLTLDEMKHAIKHNHIGIIMSMPIYNSFEHCTISKHLRPLEHRWYFTVSGLILFMERLGYRCLEVSSIETKIGREDIKSFVFRKL